MAVTEFQRTVCRLLAANRLERGESYVAGGTALNLLAGGSRLSRPGPARLREDLGAGSSAFYAGSIRGAFPQVREIDG